MTKLEKIEKDIANLNHDELSKFTAWFTAHHDALWDQQIAADASSGRLDRLISDGKKEIKSGATRPL